MQSNSDLLNHIHFLMKWSARLLCDKNRTGKAFKCIYSVFLSCVLLCAVQVMTPRIMGSPRKHGHEDLHLQSCGALSLSPSLSLRHPKHPPQPTSTSTNALASPSSENSLVCRETILWPVSQQGLKSNLWGHFRVLLLQPHCAVQPNSVQQWITIQALWDPSFAQHDCSKGNLKWSHTVSHSALWDRAKSSAETVANSDWACQCL